jgi:hypothetical protein
MVFVIFLLNQIFRLDTEIPLSEIEPAYKQTAVSFAINSNRISFFADFWRHEILKIDKNGKVLFTIGRKGNGPGEYNQPRDLVLINGESQLLVVSEGEKVQIFSSLDGSFVRTLSPYFPANGWQESGAHLLALKGPEEDLLDVFNYNGKKIGSWMRGPAERADGPTGRWHFTLDLHGTAYVSYGIHPIIYFAAAGQAKAQEWPIGVPQHYHEPPMVGFPVEQRFNRKKVEAYYTSFSQVSGLFALPESNVLLVVWRLHEPVPYAVEAYDLKTRQRVLANFHPRGRPVCSRGELLACEEILEDEAGELLAHNLVLYRYQPGAQP